MLQWREGKSEDYGIPMCAIEEMETRFEHMGICVHGYMLIQGTDILAEKYYAPYTKESNHRMYSITKSIAALAAGFLIKEGKVHLEDKICGYFPEYVSADGAHPWCAEMTIEDMLTMRTCHSSTTFKRMDIPDWTETFFKVQPDHVPGTVFSYDTSSAHVLAALTEKLTGMSMLDYLREKLSDFLEITDDAYIISDPVGISQGGSGIMCTLRDVAGLAYLCNHYGNMGGEEVLPLDFMVKALSMQVPTDLQPTLDEQWGYGYLFWMARKEGFCMYGMGGQLALCFPKLDFCLLTISDTIGNPAGLQILYDCFYGTVYPYLKERRSENPIAFLVQDTIAGRGEMHRLMEARLEKETDGIIYECYDNVMGLQWISFDWKTGVLHFANEEGEWCLKFGDSKKGKALPNQIKEQWEMQTFMDSGYRCGCRGYWRCGHFVLQCFLMDEEQGYFSMDVAWKDERIGVRMTATSEPPFRRLKGFVSARAKN